MTNNTSINDTPTPYTSRMSYTAAFRFEGFTDELFEHIETVRSQTKQEKREGYALRMWRKSRREVRREERGRDQESRRDHQDLRDLLTARRRGRAQTTAAEQEGEGIVAPHRQMETRDTVEREWKRIQEEQEREVAPSEMPEEAPGGLVFHAVEEAEDRPEGQTPLQEATAGPSRKGGRGRKRALQDTGGGPKSVKRLAKEKTALPKAFVKEVVRASKTEGRDFSRNARGSCRLYAAGR